MPPKRASTIKIAAKEEAAKEQEKRMVERMKALTKGLENALLEKSEDAMDIDEDEEEDRTPRPSTARAGARSRTATSTTSTSSRIRSNRSSCGSGSGSKSGMKPSTLVKRKSTSPVERLTKKQAIEEAAQILRVRSSNYSPSATTNASGTTKFQRTMTTSHPSMTFRGRGIPSRRHALSRPVMTTDEKAETEEDEEDNDVVMPPARQNTRGLVQVSAPAPIRATHAPLVPLLSVRTSGGPSRRSYDKGEEVGGKQSIGTLGHLGHGLFKLLTYAIIILSSVFALHVGVETYKLYTPLCFSDSFSNGQVMTGRPPNAGACKTTWCCPPLLHCHAGRIAGVVALEKVANAFGYTSITSTTSSPVPMEVAGGRREYSMKEPEKPEEAWEDEGGGRWIFGGDGGQGSLGRAGGDGRYPRACGGAQRS
ncbi:Hypothetical protein NocV09_00701810 [Nannochloropsis oceanica]